MKKILLIGLLFTTLYAKAPSKKLLYVDFYQSMSNNHLAKKFQDLYKKDIHELDLFYQLYTYHARTLQARKKRSTDTIPLIIHWIWIGDKPLPPYFERFQKSFKQMHPAWEFKLWTDLEIDTLIFINQDLYNATINPGERADIARIEILYQFGGVYVDTDVKCIGSFEVLHELFDFYAGLGPISNHIGQINNGVIGACKGHPILKKYLECMPDASTDWHVVYRTGPGLFTRAFKEALQENSAIAETAIILPASYFSPFGKNQKIIGSEQKYLRAETFAIHYYYGTWADCPGKIKKKRS